MAKVESYAEQIIVHIPTLLHFSTLILNVLQHACVEH